MKKTMIILIAVFLFIGAGSSCTTQKKTAKYNSKTGLYGKSNNRNEFAVYPQCGSRLKIVPAKFRRK